MDQMLTEKSSRGKPTLETEESRVTPVQQEHECIHLGGVGGAQQIKAGIKSETLGNDCTWSIHVAWSNCKFMHRTIAIGYEKSSLLEALLWDMQHAVLCSCWLLGESLGYITVSYFNLLVSRTGVGELIPAVSICQVSPDPCHLLGDLKVAVFFGHHLKWKNYLMNLHP